MKRLFFALAALLILDVVAESQVQPNGPGSRPTVQYSRSKMRRGPHDFTADSGAVPGASIRLCGYCHTAHVPTTGIAAPLWSRKSIVGRPPASYGTYSNPVSLDASVADIKTSNNYSSFCMSCHDGSSLFALSSYEKRPRSITGGVWDTTRTVDAEFNLYNGGEYALTHTHPVNFDYNATLASADGNLFTPATSSYVYMDNTTSPPTAVGRLFNGTMQCSSCHNPHMSSGIGIQGSNDYNRLCIACHQK